MTTETPPKKSRMPLILGVIIVVLVVALGAVFFYENNQITQLQSNLQATNGSLQTIASTYSTLSSNYSSLNAQYNDLQSNYTALNFQYNILNSQYSTLNRQYNTLNGQYNTLNSEYLSAVNESNTYEAIANMSMTQILVPYPSIITSRNDASGVWFVVQTFHIPYNGYITVQTSSYYDVEWDFTQNSNTWGVNNGISYNQQFAAGTNTSFNISVVAGTITIEMLNMDYFSGSATCTYSITYHY